MTRIRGFFHSDQVVRSNLIKQRLELVIIVSVTQCDAKIGMLRQLLGTVQPGETAANDDGVLQFLIFLLPIREVPFRPASAQIMPLVSLKQEDKLISSPLANRRSYLTVSTIQCPLRKLL